MPCVGLTSFLQSLTAVESLMDRCVNALCRAYLISTNEWHRVRIRIRRVSMPCVGLTSFLQRTSFSNREEKIYSVNALCRAYLISTQHQIHRKQMKS